MINRISGKASLRVLKFLEPLSSASFCSFSDGKHKCILLKGEGRKKMLADKDVLNALHRAALISVTDQECSLEPTGRSRLQRLKNSEENFAAQHREESIEHIKLDGAVHQVTVNHNESVLTRLGQRKSVDGKPWLNHEHVEAGERLRCDFTIGQMMQKVTSSWDGAIGASLKGRGGKADLSDNAIDARDRMEKAMHAVGPDLAGVLTDVCCFLKGLESVERERRWPPRSAKLMLRTGLDLLSRHYGTKTGTKRTGKVRHWGSRDYRPVIQ